MSDDYYISLYHDMWPLIVSAIIFILILATLSFAVTASRNDREVFRYFFGGYAVLFFVFTMAGLVNWLARDYSGPELGEETHIAFYRILWHVEHIILINPQYSRGDRFFIWSMIHALAALALFVNSIFCWFIIQKAISPNFSGLKSAFSFVLDISHKSFLSEVQSHFGIKFSRLNNHFSYNFFGMYTLAFAAASYFYFLEMIILFIKRKM